MNHSELYEVLRLEVNKHIDLYLEDKFLPTVERAQLTHERESVVSIGISMLMTRWNVGVPGGSFVQAVSDNNLSQSILTADHINRHIIAFYVKLLYNADPRIIR